MQIQETEIAVEMPPPLLRPKESTPHATLTTRAARAAAAARRVVNVALGLIPWVAGEAAAFRSPPGNFDHIFPVSQITPFEITPLKGSELNPSGTNSSRKISILRPAWPKNAPRDGK